MDEAFGRAVGAVFGWDPIFEPVDGQVAGQPALVSAAAIRSYAIFLNARVGHFILALTSSQTFGEMTMEQKAGISHRGRALSLLRAHLLTLV